MGCAFSLAALLMCQTWNRFSPPGAGGGGTVIPVPEEERGGNFSVAPPAAGIAAAPVSADDGPSPPHEPAAAIPWVDVGPQVEALRFTFSKVGGTAVHRAWNDVQAMTVEAGAESIRAIAAGGEKVEFHLSLEAPHFEGSAAIGSTKDGWIWTHTNGPDGLMQELIVPDRPEGVPDGRLEIVIPVTRDGLSVRGGGQEIVFEGEGGEEVFRYREIRAWDAGGAELAASMEWREGASAIAWVVRDEFARYPLRIDPLLTRAPGFLQSPDGLAANQEFGMSADAAGDWIAAGAPGTAGGGKVYLFRRDRARVAQWDATGTLAAPGGGAGDRFGNRLRFFGSKCLVVANQPGGGVRPSLFVFERSGETATVWDHAATLQIPSGTGENLGERLEMTDGLLLATSTSGEVFLWRQAGAAWMFAKRFADGQSPGGAFGGFGTAACIAGNFVAVSEPSRTLGSPPYEFQGGRVTIYHRDQGGENQWGAGQVLDGTPEKRGMGYGMHRLGERLLITTTQGVESYGRAGGGTLFVPLASTPLASLPVRFSGRFGSSGTDVREFDEDGNGRIVSALPSVPGASSYEPCAIGISGGVVVRGQPYFQSGGTPTGRIVIDEMLRPTMPMTQAIIHTESGTTLSRLGGAVAMDGDLMVVGAPRANRPAGGGSQVGRAYLFRRDAATGRFVFERTLAQSVSAAGDLYGSSISVRDRVIAVGAPGANSGAGRVFVFDDRKGTGWPLVRRIDGAAGEALGSAVAVGTNGWVACGAPMAANGGRVRLYRSDAGGRDNWGFVTDVTNPATSTPEGDGFGSSVEMQGEILLIGAPAADGLGLGLPALGIAPERPNAGRAYLFSWNGEEATGSWTLTKALPRANNFGHFGTTGGRFGARVALDGEIAAVSEPGTRRVHVFDRSRTATVGFSVVPWEPVAALSGPGMLSQGQTEFGAGGIALRGRRLAVGDAADGRIVCFEAHGYAEDDWRPYLSIRPPVAAHGSGFAEVITMGDAGLELAAGLPASGQGEVMIFTRMEDTFRPATIVSEPGAAFVQQVALDGDQLLIGTGSGGVIVRRNSGGNNQWGNGTALNPPVAFGGTSLGAVALAQGRAFVGQTGLSGNSMIGPGRVHIYRQGNLQWSHEATLMEDDPPVRTGYGGSLASDGDLLVVGHSWLSDQPPFPSGRAYRRGSGGAGGWTWQDYRNPGFVDGLAASGDFCLGANVDGTEIRYPNHQSLQVPASGNIAPEIGRSLVAASGRIAMIASRNQAAGAIRFFRVHAPNGSLNTIVEELPELSLGADMLRGIALDGPFCACVDSEGNFTVLRLKPAGNGWTTLLTDRITLNFAGTVFDVVQPSILSLSQGRLAIAGDEEVRIYDLLPRYERWLKEQFDSASLQDPALESTVWGDLADVNERGISNIARAYHGLSLDDANPQRRLPRAVRDSGGGRVLIVWERAQDTHGVEIVPFWSPDLTRWYRSGEGPEGDVRTLVRRTLEDDGHSVKESVSFENETAPKGFIRLAYWR